MPSLAVKYRPKTFEDVTEQSVVTEMLKGICESDELQCRNFLLTGPAGTGKALANSEVVLTSEGWKAVGDVIAGDTFFTRNGAATKVIGVYPQGRKKCYRLNFSCGGESSSIVVSEDHLNCVYITERKWYVPEMLTSDIRMLHRLGISVYIDSVTNYANTDKYKKSQCGFESFKSAIQSFSSVLSSEYRKLSSVDFVGELECTCFYVDDPDHTFLAGGMIPTHNTTSARIMANILNEGKGEPIELDAASNSGVDNIRELIRQARMMPIGTKYKIFIMDEVHALSNPAWQALLLPLEAGVGNSIFLMATTNPEKIPPTIISRVQTFQLSKISLKGIQDRLKYIVEAENKEGQGITYTDDAINYIAKLAQGGMRDAITLLEKSLTYSKDITTENLMKSLNLPNYDDFFELLGAYAKRDNKTIAEVVDRVYNSGVNFIKWFNDFHAFVINITKYIFLQDISMTMIPSIYQDKISNYNVKHSTVCLKLANKLVTMNHELKTSQYLQELVLTYLCSTPKKGE